ncbi:hypothetical protein LY474_01095 [Myxococcus stipitatus]|uniref:hypothetical protein n=1 Tax=Myxococcus stipitatus TaxID=83455 RepID=UPI001F2E8E15|nr:hypothetical protein [Myxococcus stipitatus]MCE9666394.1 hypothetical protein [Myxococcus stipitatus]
MLHVLAGILTTASLSSASPHAGPAPFPEETDPPSTSACTTLDTPSGGRATVCKSWVVSDGELYEGSWWTRSRSGNVRLDARVDDTVMTGWSGQYSGTARIRLQLCNQGTGKCSGWW